MSREIIEAVRAIEREKGIEGEALLTALEDALLAAYRKTPDAVAFARVEIDREIGVFRVHQFVGEELPDDAIVLLDEEELEAAIEASDGTEDEEIGFTIDWTKVPQSMIDTVEVTPEHSFGRIAAQTAKQVIMQRIREAERGIMYDEYIDRVGDLVTGVVQQSERGVTLVELGRAEAILPYSESIPGERYDHGARVKAVILEVRNSPKGPQIVLSRGSEDFLRRIFELEVPEVADELVIIRSVAREPGYRSKIAVESSAPGVDPVGACVGPRGSRVRMVVSELRGEKIDIIPYNEEPARFIAKALSPARVREVLVDDEERQATVVVPDDQLALAIGREGQNARLAARLTGWRIDIRGATEFSETEDGDSEGGGEAQADEQPGRCKAVMSNGKRCPNASVEGSLYCSLPHHQALANAPEADAVVPSDDDAAEEVEAVAEATPEDGEGDASDAGADDDARTEEAEAEEEIPVEAVVASDAGGSDDTDE